MTAIRDQAANQSITSGGTSEQCSSTSEQCRAAQYIKQCRTGRCFRLGAAQPMWSCCAIARRSVTSGGSSTIAQQEASPGCLCEGAEKCCNPPPMKCSHSPPTGIPSPSIPSPTHFANRSAPPPLISIAPTPALPPSATLTCFSAHSKRCTSSSMLSRCSLSRSSSRFTFCTRAEDAT